MSKEHQDRIREEMERIDAFISEMSRETGKPVHAISRLLGRSPSVVRHRTKNPWSIYQAWYAAHEPREENGPLLTGSCLISY